MLGIGLVMVFQSREAVVGDEKNKEKRENSAQTAPISVERCVCHG